MSPSFDLVVDKYRTDISLTETEDSWERIAKAFIALKTCCQDGNFSSTSEVVQTIRSFHSPINNALLSERTRLSAAAMELVDSVATACEADFELLLPQVMPTLMVLTGRTNKVVITRAKACIFNILDITHSALLLSYFSTHLQEKSSSMRLISAQCALAYLKCCNPPDIERESRAAEVESIIRKTARDASADVRKVGREIFGAYRLLLPSRVDKFTAPLTPTMRKYLDIKAAANPAPSSKPALTKMKSMTAMAAASKEKEREKQKRPVAGHSRTGSNASNSTSTKTQERNPAPARPDVRPSSSLAASRPTRPTAQEQVTVVAQRAESSRQALFSSGSSTGPSRVLSSSADAPKPSTRTRVAPSATTGPQRPLSRPVAQQSAASSTQPSFGPRRVPMPDPSQSTGPVMQKAPERPASRAAAAATSRPASQQSRPIKPVANAPPRAPVKPARAMLPPKTRADGSALGGPPNRPTAGGSSKANVEAKPARARPALTQPTASQLAKVKALVINKTGPKKVGALPTRSEGKPTSSNVLSKSSKANIGGSSTGTKKLAKPTKADVAEIQAAASVPLPPSPKPEPVLIPLPDPTPCELDAERGDVAEGDCPAREQEPVPEVAVQAELEQPAQPTHFRLPLLDSSVYGDGDGILCTPMHPEVKSLGWNNAKTPISALLTSIQQGFEFSPSSPVSPPYTYVSGDKDTMPFATQLF